MEYMSRDAAVEANAVGARGTRRSPSRRLGVAVIGLMIPLSLVAVGCGVRATPTPIPSEEEPTIEPSATPGDTPLLTIHGTGDKESEEFSASGESVDVKFDYKCSPDNSFTINFYGAGVSPALPDVITDEFGTARADTVNEPLNGTTGPFHLEIVTQCDWSVTVLGSK